MAKGLTDCPFRVRHRIDDGWSEEYFMPCLKERCSLYSSWLVLDEGSEYCARMNGIRFRMSEADFKDAKEKRKTTSSIIQWKL